MSWPSFAVVFGAYLKEARDHKAWSQKTLSKKADVQQSTISALELGGGGEGRKVKRGARAEHIDALLEALGVSVIDACKRMAIIGENLEKARMNAQAETSLGASEQTERSAKEKEQAQEPPLGYDLPPSHVRIPGTKRGIMPKKYASLPSSKEGEAPSGAQPSHPSPRKRRRNK